MLECKRMFVSIIAMHDEHGKVTPTEIILYDGRRYLIDRVLDVRHATALKTGGQGLRYTVRIAGKETYLFFDSGKWFVEAKGAVA